MAVTTPVKRRESAKAAAAFRIYQDLGYDRSLRAVASRLGRCQRIVERWSAQHGWVARVQAWDERQGEIRARRRLREREDMEDRHVGIAKGFQAKVIERLQTIDVKALKPSEIAAWFEVSVRVERLALGCETERVATDHTGGVAVDDLSDPMSRLVFEDPLLERAVLEAMMRRSRGEQPVPSSPRAIEAPGDA